MPPESAVGPDTHPPVAVVVPCRDAARLLPGLADCLARQGHQADEVIVVDDGSTDDTAAVARSSGARVLRSDGSGPYAARNVGWRSSTADIVVFVDVRSRPHGDWLGRLLEQFASASVGLATTDVRVVGGDRLAERAARRQRIFDVADFVDTPWFLPYAPTCNLAVRRSVLAELDGFAVGRSGLDADLCWRAQLECHASLAVVRETLMDWLPRTQVHDMLRQQLRYGRSNRSLRQRYRPAGAEVPPATPLLSLAGTTGHHALALAVKVLLGRRQRAAASVVALGGVAYSLGYRAEGYRAPHSGRHRGLGSLNG